MRALAILTASYVGLAFACTTPMEPPRPPPPQVAPEADATDALVRAGAPQLVVVHERPRQEIEPTFPTPRARLDAWAERYPDALRALRAWYLENPIGARALLRWDEHESDLLHVITDWALTHKFETVDAFLLARDAWPDLPRQLERDPSMKAALEGYLAFCRAAPRAAAELVAHPHGLAWQGAQLFLKRNITAVR